MRDRLSQITMEWKNVLKVLTVTVGATAICLVASAISVAQVQTPSFRIESQVYLNEDPAPVSQNVTLFDDRIVYDFQLGASAERLPTEIVVFDEAKRELVLLDVQRRLSWTVADLRLLKMVDHLRRETANNAQANFLVKQNYVEEHDWATNVVSLKSELFEYLLTGKRPDNDTILPRYYDFLDQFTRLTASDPKRMPPFPRLALNKSIKTFGWIPSEVKVAVEPNAFVKDAFSATSKHVLTMSLSDADRHRIDFARKCWYEFESCTLAEYRQIPAPSKRTALKSKQDQAEGKITR